MIDKYGAGEDPYCYPGTTVLRNRLGLRDEQVLSEAEQAFSTTAAQRMELAQPPYDFALMKSIHRHLFGDIYEWAGEVRSVDISKDTTRFCTVGRIEPEAKKLFHSLATANWLAVHDRSAFVAKAAELFGDLNMIHPFREGNGRTLRILFENIIINAGYEISWWQADKSSWMAANIDAVFCDYRALTNIFERCIGPSIRE